jgi:pyruvate dehydrogenase E2 component (dihydrolipoamide acetyltransferase)
VAKEVIMPKFGFTQEDSQILAWIKNEGDTVEKGDPIAEVSTDKVSMEIEAPEDGILSGIRYPVGAVVPVTKIVAYILQPGEALPAEEGEPETTPSVVAEKVEDKAGSATPVAARMAKDKGIDLSGLEGSGPGGRIIKQDVESFLSMPQARSGKVNATPAARTLAARVDVDLMGLSGSGPQGRIQAVDVERASVPAASLAEPVRQATQRSIPYSGMRRAIGQNLQASYQQIPHIMLEVDVDMTASEALRARANQNLQAGQEKVSLTAMIARAVAWSLGRTPIINSRLEGDQIILLPEINLGIAVSLEGGLLVPVIQSAQNKGTLQIALELREAIERARSGKLRQTDLQDGTFSISNLGMLGVDRFSAIINPPQTAILAVGRVRKQFVPDTNGQPVLHSVMTATLSADHRVIDGADAARFLADLRQALENPEVMTL